MKAKKLLGSIALTAALAMGTMPAFASTTAPSDWLTNVDQGIGGAGVSDNTQLMNVNQTNASDPNSKVGTGSTAVKASVFDADLNVTVPLQLSVAFASTGSELTTPSSGAYKITNNGTKNDVKLTRVVGSASGGFTLDTVQNCRDAISGGTDSSAYKIGIILNINGKKVDLATAANWNITGTTDGGYLGATSTTNPFNGNPVPTIAKNGGVLAIDLEGSTNLFTQNPLAVGYQSSTIANIQYTVEIA